MKKHHIIMFVYLFFLCDCVSIKTVKPIDSYHLVDGKSNAKTEVEALTKFVFENHSQAIDFKLFLNNRYQDRTNFNIQNYWVIEKETEFNVQVLTDSQTSQYVDLISPLLTNGRDREIVKEGNIKHYVVMVITNKQGEDCLSNSSIFKYIALEYLDSLRKEYIAN